MSCSIVKISPLPALVKVSNFASLNIEPLMLWVKIAMLLNGDPLFANNPIVPLTVTFVSVVALKPKENLSPYSEFIIVWVLYGRIVPEPIASQEM